VKLLSRLLAILLLLCVLPATAFGQAGDWRERPTHYFTILYTAGDEASAETYSGFADKLYDEVSGVFGHQVATPIVLRLYPTLDRYYDLNPRARGLTGVVAHADFRRNEVSVIIEQTAGQTDVEVLNNVRHELTHMIASDLSENRLNVGFQEGLAQVVELPAPELDRKIALLQQAYDNQELLAWSDFDQRDRIYGDVNVAYPESMSVVAFLVERYTFAKMREFVENSAHTSGYRSALERTYGVAPDELERQWLEWLPSYLSGGYRGAKVDSFDLSRAEQLLGQGMYAAAQQELDTVINAMRAAGNTAELAHAQSLQARSVSGQQADELARQAHDALATYDYALAGQLAGQARSLYDSIGATHQNAALDEYMRRAQQGASAQQSLDQAAAQARLLRYPQARLLADQAAAQFTALGDRERASAALQLRAFLDQRQVLVGGVLLLLGLGGVAMSLVRRVMVREAEAW
jgi:hypothetical protein